MNFKREIKAAMARRGVNVPTLVRMIEFDDVAIRKLEQALYRFLRDEKAGLSMQHLEAVLQALGLELKARK